MAADESLKKALGKATELEKNYDWMGSVELLRNALSMISEQDANKTAEIHELMGYGLFRAAFQADSADDFKKRMRMSVESYEKAAELLNRIDEAGRFYCIGMSKYAEWRLAESPPQAKQLLDDCCKLLKDVLERLDVVRHRLRYGRCFYNLWSCFWERRLLVESWNEGKQIVEEGIRFCQDAIAKLSQLEETNELALVYALTSAFIVGYLEYLQERSRELVKLSSDYLERAVKLSEKTREALTLQWLATAQGVTSWFVKGDLQSTLNHFQNRLEESKKLGDHFLIGLAYYALTLVIEYEGTTEEDPDKAKEVYKKAIRFAEESILHGLLVCDYSYVSTAHQFIAESYLRLAESEMILEEKRAFLKSAVEEGRRGSEYAELSGSLLLTQENYHTLSKAIFFLSETETGFTEKKRLLEEALELRKKDLTLSSQLYPPSYWNRGVSQNYLALIHADLAKIEKNEETKKHLLEEAASSMERCLEICTKYLQTQMTASTPRDFAVLGWYHDWFSDILTQKWLTTKDENIINRTIEVHRDAAQVYQKAGMPSRVAEAYWKAARLYDGQGEYVNAAESFEHAAENYHIVAEKIPQFKCFYQDHESYMQAWSEFEKAKLAHQKEEYAQSKTHYETAANLLKSTKRWNYLAPNFSAWATLERAEDLSKKEESDESREAFQRAAHQFREAKASIEAKAKQTESLDEKTKALELSRASDYRSEYSLARAELEEAKTSDKNEDHEASKKKYGTAAKRFEEIAERLEDKSERNELLFQASMCRALEKMESAEEKAEPDLYSEAAELFTKTQKITTKKRNALLALGNACFCKALESGTKFKLTPDADLYTTAKQYMERAAHHYTEAGFETAAKWTKATQRLFDAYFYMCNAESEVDTEKKARHYQLAEKHLDLAARLYETAGYISKRDETLKHLERVREEKELFISPADILKAASIVSATPMISTPTPNDEEPVGIEGFEHANIQANLIIRLKEVKVGEDLDLEIELVNAGKRPALLIKTEHIIPEGFEIKEKPEIYRVEDSYLNMKGKKLDSLKTEEVKLVLRALTKGTFTINPRVLYLDETGKYRSYELEPATIKVKEIGITGWLKGP